MDIRVFSSVFASLASEDKGLETKQEKYVNSINPLSFQKHTWLLLVSWVLIVSASMALNYFQIKRMILKLAESEATGSLNKNLAYWNWAGAHGSLYVPVTEETQPNPYLAHLKQRDIETSNGLKLTLINPAYMIRQVYELADKQYGSKGHITSLDPLRPLNAPDAWERNALRSFASGKDEAVSLEQINGREYLRLMRPITTDESCLKCHITQGLQVGDVRGGISVSVPIEPYRNAFQNNINSLLFGHSIFLFLGLTCIGVADYRIRQHSFDKKLAEQGTLAEKENLDNMLQAMTDEVCIINQNYEITYLNPAMKKEFGELDRRRCYEYFHKLSEPCSWCYLSDVINGTPKQCQRYYLTRQKTFDLVDIPIQNRDGSISKLHILRDVTERQAMEQALRQAKEEMEAQNEELKELDKMKDRLIRDVTHELKTPIAKQNMQLEMLSYMIRKEPDNKYEKFINSMQSVIKRQENVINNILHMARLEAGGIKYKQKELRLDLLLEKVVTDFQDSLQKHNFVVVWDIDEITIISDKELLSHVFGNFISNAIKYRKTVEQPRLQISLARDETTVIVRITDNGVGMSPHDLENAFERFYQSSASNEGCGVGLSIVKMIVRELNGHTWCESDGPDKGTTAVLQLPL